MLATKVGTKEKEEEDNAAEDVVAMVDVSPTKVMRLSTTPAPTSEEKERRETKARKERKVTRGTESKAHPGMATPPLMELVERYRPHQERLQQKERQLTHLLSRRHQSLPPASRLIMGNSSKALCTPHPGPKEIGRGTHRNGGEEMNKPITTPSTPGQGILTNITTLT